MKNIATISSILCAAQMACAEAYCLQYAECQPALENQIYTKAYAVRQPDRSWRLNFGYYGFIDSTVRISVYGFTPYGPPVCLDSKVYVATPVASWSTAVYQCDIYYQVTAQIIILRNNQPVDSASVQLHQ